MKDTRVRTYVVSTTHDDAIRVRDALTPVQGVLWTNGRLLASPLDRDAILARLDDTIGVAENEFWNAPLPRHVRDNLPRMTQLLVQASDTPREKTPAVGRPWDSAGMEPPEHLDTLDLRQVTLILLDMSTDRLPVHVHVAIWDETGMVGEGESTDNALRDLYISVKANLLPDARIDQGLDHIEGTPIQGHDVFKEAFGRLVAALADPTNTSPGTVPVRIVRKEAAQ